MDEDKKIKKEQRDRERFEQLVKTYGEREARRILAENERMKRQVEAERRLKKNGGDGYGHQQGSVDGATEAGQIERGTKKMSGVAWRENKRYD